MVLKLSMPIRKTTMPPNSTLGQLIDLLSLHNSRQSEGHIASKMFSSYVVLLFSFVQDEKG